MSSTANQVGILMSVMTQNTAAFSSVTDLKQNVSKASPGFDGVLTQISDTMKKTQFPNEMTPDKIDQNENDQIISRETLRNYDNPEQADDKKINDLNSRFDENDKIDEFTDNEKSVDEINVPVLNDLKELNEVDTMLQEAINENGKKIISEIADLFEVSEDEVVNVMQMLGIVPADLLNPENLQNLVQNIGGQDKALDLITDSDLYTSLQDLIEGAESMRSELMNEFDLSQEDLQAAIENTSKRFKDIIQVEKSPEVILNEAGEELKRDINVPQSDKTSAVKAEVISEQRQTIEQDRPVEVTYKSNDSGKNNHEGFKQDTGVNLFNQLVENISEAVNADQTSAMQYTDRAQMENIIRQITEKITVITGEETSMELQLHPASLGNVNVLLTSSKDGIVAKFTAQNEIVKEAMESQMTQLQQKFEERGIKVTSIEITIESHAFEQNMNNQNHNQGFEEPRNGSRRGIRRINLSEINGIEEVEEIDEADKIAAQMMAANGNTVDFTA